ncbi:hypothetical protein V6N11_084356 [Hibiscus sabdariffa]|uniref:Uncharacterized protein n=1 Tax=Hibiscus sabdariffa TaxID=183260 RepID=A0ABR2QSV8_9ROSI
MEKPKRKGKSPRHWPNEGLPRQKISQADILQLVTAVKARPIFPPENSWQSNPHMASARYAMVSAKSRWEEQGFHFDDSLPNYGLEKFVYNRLNELG